jgi:Recombination endonuclease VII
VEVNHYQLYGKKWYEKNKVTELKRNKDYYQEVGKQKKLEAYPERRKRILKSRYGITPEEFEIMLVKQNNTCAICEQSYHLTMHIDHCHTTKKIRGLLCNNCNRGLGHFKDNSVLLKNAINYLEIAATA